jgi:hypothetical protein
MHFAYLTQPQVPRQNTVGNMILLCQESSHGQLLCCWLGFGLGLCSCKNLGLNFWWDKLDQCNRDPGSEWDEARTNKDATTVSKFAPRSRGLVLDQHAIPDQSYDHHDHYKYIYKYVYIAV